MHRFYPYCTTLQKKLPHPQISVTEARPGAHSQGTQYCFHLPFLKICFSCKQRPIFLKANKAETSGSLACHVLLRLLP